MPDVATIHYKDVFYRLISYFKAYKAVLAVSVFALIIYGAIDAAMIKLIQPLIDSGFSSADGSMLKMGAGIIVALFLVRGLASFVSGFGLAWVSNHIIQKMRQQLFDKMLQLPVRYFDKNSTGSLISKITYDTEQVALATSQVLVTLIREGVTILGLLALMFYESWQLSLVFFLIGPLIGIVISVVSKRFRIISRSIQNAMGQVTTSTEQMLKAQKIILAFSGEEKEAARFGQINKNNRQQAMKLVVAKVASTPLIQFIGSFAIAIVLYIASYDQMRDTLSAGSFIAIVTAMGSLMRPLKQISKVNGDLQRGLTACASVFALLDQESERDTGTVNLARASGALEINNLSFTYDGQEQPALSNINLSIKAGQTIALVGRSGSGKSTLADLLMRFYDYQTGQIRLDSQDLGQYPLSVLRQQFALVSQQVVLFDDTIANNISYGAVGAVSREQIEAAAEAAHVDEFAKNMPLGLDSPVGENGTNLSGGQRQRIAIARAILRDAPILILDEATSALDTESERAIQSALTRLLDNKTSIIIAHRLSTIEHADCIVVMDQGRIIEQGSHQQLLAKGGAYSLLHNMQFSVEQD
ncbi:MAG: lipid A export permease/ATP-binding protein MsbA [Gammaproteobacteria bacterium]|nr:lipid A export permease/ATP-binding protein MsbA [Gammaproteobacteria bacterium]